VYLKSNEDCLSGIFFDSDEESIYLQDDDYLVIAVMKENISFCTSEGFTTSNNPTPKKNVGLEVVKQQSSVLVVKIDGELVSKISVGADMNLATCSSEIVDLVYTDKKVQEALTGLVQKTIEYDVGELNIITSSNCEKSDVSFSLPHGIGEGTLNPSDLVIKLGGKNK